MDRNSEPFVNWPILISIVLFLLCVFFLGHCFDEPGSEGKMMIYHEDGWVAEVTVIKDESDSVWECKTLRVVRTIQNNSIMKTPPDGEVFDVEKLKAAGGFPGLWYLTEDRLR